MRCQRKRGILPSSSGFAKDWQTFVWIAVGLLVVLLVACKPGAATSGQPQASAAHQSTEAASTRLTSTVATEATATAQPSAGSEQAITAPASGNDGDTSEGQLALGESPTTPAVQAAIDGLSLVEVAAPAAQAPSDPPAPPPVSPTAADPQPSATPAPSAPGGQPSAASTQPTPAPPAPSAPLVTEVDLDQVFALPAGGEVTVKRTDLQLKALAIIDYGPQCLGGPMGCPWRLRLLVTDQNGASQELLLSKLPVPDIESSHQVFGFVINFLRVEGGQAVLKVTQPYRRPRRPGRGAVR